MDLPPKSDDAIRVNFTPDASDTRLLQNMQQGGASQCVLAPGLVTIALRHKTVEEIWYVLSGEGEMWIRKDEQEEVIKMKPGTSLSVLPGTSFQFRNTGARNFTAWIATVPPTPEEDDTVVVTGHWA